MSVKPGTGEGQSLQAHRARAVIEAVSHTALGPPRWRVSPEPFWISREEARFFESLGSHLFAFYRALNDLYDQSAGGRLPRWISDYLDQGKPSDLVGFGRMKRFRAHLPGIIRPDIILTPEGAVCTELDSVPGGFGMTACLARFYTEQGSEVIGGPDGIIDGFARMIRTHSDKPNPNLAIVVSEESKDYLAEMQWLGGALDRKGLKIRVIHPEELTFRESGMFTVTPGDHQAAKEEECRLDVIYRFFELFDLKNIPKSELILYAVKKELVTLTPPAKAYLEEKLAMALFQHPALRSFWLEALGSSAYSVLEALFPQTWILDPREVPPHAVIPGLRVGDRCVTDWNGLYRLTQKERRFVIKPSGFSELAWGSRGVTVGHDVSGENWGRTIDHALETFDQIPQVLQRFHKGRHVQVAYYEPEGGRIKTMTGRVRLCPYYFVADGRAELGGILATVCPLDKKLLHGMAGAVMVPCGISESGPEGGGRT